MKIRVMMATVAGMLLTMQAMAQEDSPAGLWKSIDDQTGKPKALVRIVDKHGTFSGKIEKLFPEPGADQNPLCEKCEGDLKGKPIIGLTILSDLKADGDVYTGGRILDPANGKVYKSKLTLIDGGKKLEVRGYIGTPLLGRTQTWTRMEP